MKKAKGEGIVFHALERPHKTVIRLASVGPAPL